MAKPSKKSQDLQSIWENRINRAKKVRKSWKDLFRVDLIRDYLDGKQRNPAYTAEDWITINNIYSHMKAQLPALYSADPYFYVKLARSYKPNPAEIVLWEQRGKIRGAYLNYLKRELKLKTKARVSIQDAFSSYGCIKVRYQADISDNDDAGKPIMSEEGEPLLDDSGEPLMEPEQLAANGKYKIERVHPDDILWDEDAGPLEDTWGWVAQRIRMSLDDAKKDKRYSKAALKLLEGKGEGEDDEQRAREERKKGGEIAGRADMASEKTKKGAPIEEPEQVAFWEIYHLKEDQWLTIAENGDIPLADPAALPPGVEGHPFGFLFFTSRDDSPYPHPPLSPLMDPAKEYNQARSDIQKHRKRFNRKYTGSKQAVTPEDVSKFESGDDGTLILVNGSAQGAIAPVQDAQMDPMRYNELSYLKGEMVELAGHNSAESMGLAAADTATQAGILDKRLEMKEGDAISMVMDFVIDIARKLDMLVQIHIDRDEAVKISGPQGEFWELVRAQDYEDVEGEYEYTVNPGATMPRLPHIERASWQAFLGLLATMPHLATSKRLMMKMAEMHHIEDDAMVEELHQIAVKIMSGAMPMPGQSGSQAGVPEERPVSAAGGAAGGVQSLSKGNAAIGG